MTSDAAMLRTQVSVEQRIFWRNRSSMFFTFLLPIALLLVVAVSSDPVEAVPFIAALGILSTGFQGLGIQLAMHRDQGVLKRLMATPLPTHLFILGKVISTTIVIAIEVSIMVTAGVLGFGAPFPHDPALLALFVLLGTFTFVALGFACASLIPTSDSAPAITNAAYLGLILITTVLTQVGGIPDAIAHIGDVLPLTNVFTPIAHAWVGGWETKDWWSAVVLVAWGLAGALWTARHFRWEPAGER